MICFNCRKEFNTKHCPYCGKIKPGTNSMCTIGEMLKDKGVKIHV